MTATAERDDAAVRANIEWFRRSGVMRPNDGFWGVAERVLVLQGNEAAEQIHRAFPCQTPLAPGVVALEHRRADCNMQAAFLFDLAAERFGDPALKVVADNLLGYLRDRSLLLNRDEKSPTVGLWGWANPGRTDKYWTDDNAWVATLLLLLADRGRPELRPAGIAAARALQRHAERFLRHLSEQGKEAPYADRAVQGMRLNPHWMGLVTMALAHAAAVDAQPDYAGVVEEYHRTVLSGPPKHDTLSARPTSTGLPWALSEYAYLCLAASVAGMQFRQPHVIAAARAAADILIRYQSPAGHFRSEHFETPNAPHLADLVYTQNWATLGLYHASKLLESSECRRAFDLSLDFLCRIQDRSPEPYLAGCWRGLYDTSAGRWGGGDQYEGGAGSIYSGWTNAPIATAFLLDRTGRSLFPGGA